MYAALISYASSQPGLTVPFNIWDKAAHATEYGVLAALIWRAIGGSFFAAATPWRAAGYLGACGLYGVLDEFHQSFVPGRDASALDVTADVVGAAAVLAALWIVSSVRRVRRDRRTSPPQAQPEICLLSRPGCGLCDEAERVILDVRAEIPFGYRKVDVRTDPELERIYGDELPVVLMSGRKIFKFRVDAGHLRRRLLRASSEVL